MEIREILTKTHFISVTLFLVIYLVKTVLLLMNAKDALAKFKRFTKVPEMVVSTLFLLTGVWMIAEIGSVNTLQIIKLVLVFASIPLAIIGFKKENKVLAVVSLLFIIGAFGLAEMNKKKQLKVDTTVVSGKEIYSSKCVSCHGDDGAKQAMGASNLAVSTLGDDELKNVISNGRKGMQAYKLAPAQLDSVTAYVKSLRK